ncbi:MAG: translation initiation factor [Flavobacterium sp.]
MDLQEQLKKLFPDHLPSEEIEPLHENETSLFLQKEPLMCKFEKRKGKATTIIEGYLGSPEDFKILTKSIQKKFNVGGSIKEECIILQGDYRDKIMVFLQEMGFKTKRVGG